MKILFSCKISVIRKSYLALKNYASIYLTENLILERISGFKDLELSPKLRNYFFIINSLQKLLLRFRQLNWLIFVYNCPDTEKWLWNSKCPTWSKNLGRSLMYYSTSMNFHILLSGDPALTYLQLPLWQWGAGNIYLLVLSSWKVTLLKTPLP